MAAHEPPQDYLSFFQSPSFYYLTGLREPDAALVMVKKNGQVSATMFVQPRLPAREVWTGARMGTGAVETLTGIRGRSSDELAAVLDSLAGTGQPFLVVGDVPAHDAEAEGQPARRALGGRPASRRVEAEASSRSTSRRSMTWWSSCAAPRAPAELSLIKQAVEITVRAQKEAISALTDGHQRVRAPGAHRVHLPPQWR